MVNEITMQELLNEPVLRYDNPDFEQCDSCEEMIYFEEIHEYDGVNLCDECYEKFKDLLKEIDDLPYELYRLLLRRLADEISDEILRGV